MSLTMAVSFVKVVAGVLEYSYYRAEGAYKIGDLD
jgi:hypothetical protein